MGLCLLNQRFTPPPPILSEEVCDGRLLSTVIKIIEQQNFLYL